MLEIPFKCFFDFTCFSTVLFFRASVSWQALHLTCPRTHSRCCPGNSLILSQTIVLELGFLCSRLALYWPLFTITIRLREIEAFSGSTSEAPLLTVVSKGFRFLRLQKTTWRPPFCLHTVHRLPQPRSQGFSLLVGGALGTRLRLPKPNSCN